jgi:hypothetical protein
MFGRRQARPPLAAVLAGSRAPRADFAPLPPAAPPLLLAHGGDLIGEGGEQGRASERGPKDGECLAPGEARPQRACDGVEAVLVHREFAHRVRRLVVAAHYRRAPSASLSPKIGR